MTTAAFLRWQKEQLRHIELTIRKQCISVRVNRLKVCKLGGTERRNMRYYANFVAHPPAREAGWNSQNELGYTISGCMTDLAVH
jgi:hypothetical protein